MKENQESSYLVACFSVEGEVKEKRIGHNQKSNGFTLFLDGVGSKEKIRFTSGSSSSPDSTSGILP